MKKDLSEFLWALFLLVLFCGKDVAQSFLKGFVQIFQNLFPTLVSQSIEDILTSPYFIVRIILIICSCFGVWLGRRKSKFLYQIISIVVAISTLISFCTN